MSTRRTSRLLLLLLISVVLGAPAVGHGPVSAATPVAAGAAGPTPLAARGFRGGRGYGYGYRSPRRFSRYNRGRRGPNIGRFFGNVLRWLGIAYLFHLLFGWGAGGGSAFGLLLLLALVGGVIWLVSRSRRRRERWYREA
jgi:hypothetical protein